MVPSQGVDPLLKRAEGWMRFVTLFDQSDDEKIERIQAFKNDLPVVALDVVMQDAAAPAPAQAHDVVQMFGGEV